MTRYCLYRAYSASGECLYIGISKSWGTRWVCHFRDSPWAYEVARLDIEWFSDMRTALDREKDAIHFERPRWNWTHLRDGKSHAPVVAR